MKQGARDTKITLHIVTVSFLLDTRSIVSVQKQVIPEVVPFQNTLALYFVQ